MNLPQHILLIVRTDVAPEMEEEFNRWYNEEHIPLLLRVPGVLWAKRAVNVGRVRNILPFMNMKVLKFKGLHPIGMP